MAIVMTRRLGRSLFVGRLNFRTIEADLRYHFEQCGPVDACEVARDSTGNSKGFGFVVFSRPQDAEFAVQQLEESFLDGKKIHVEFSKPVLRRRMETKKIEREVRRRNEGDSIPPLSIIETPVAGCDRSSPYIENESSVSDDDVANNHSCHRRLHRASRSLHHHHRSHHRHRR
jgi:RNA recognition motif-containing protein